MICLAHFKSLTPYLNLLSFSQSGFFPSQSLPPWRLSNVWCVSLPNFPWLPFFLHIWQTLSCHPCLLVDRFKMLLATRQLGAHFPFLDLLDSSSAQLPRPDSSPVMYWQMLRALTRGKVGWWHMNMCTHNFVMFYWCKECVVHNLSKILSLVQVPRGQMIVPEKFTFVYIHPVVQLTNEYRSDMKV